jgi:hypothetical protein
MYGLAGEDVSIRVAFTDGLDPFVPDDGSASYSIRGNDGVLIEDYIDVPITTSSLTTAVTLTVPAELNDITASIEVRTLVVKALRLGNQWTRSYHVRLTEYQPHWIEPRDVRDYLGVNPQELPDNEIDLTKSYLELAELVGASVLSTALTSGGIAAVRANDLVLYKTVLDLFPSLELRIVQSETNGEKEYARLSKLTLDKLRQATADRFGALVAILAGTTVVQSEIFLLSTQIDPFTNA